MDIYLFSGTHWDREWYQTFQGFRFKLVKTLNELMEGLETNKEYGCFHLDGQTIVLEDYLEVMPQNKDRLKALIENGKLLVGPWYCMPDEFLLSGESLIKNLQKGFQISRSFHSEPLKFGYICDIFGHIAQMPQIFTKFGIHNALLGRGTNEHTTPMHFCWQGIDGSTLTTFKLQDNQGYGDFSRDVVINEQTAPSLSDEVLKERIKALVDSEISRSNVPVLLLMDAVDHACYHVDTPRYIKLIKELYPTANVHHKNIMHMCNTLKEFDLPVKYGELNEPAKLNASYIHLITHTLSSRYPIKKANDQLQTILEKTISPFYAFHLVDLPQTYLEIANTYLLQNHPHDSICGCSIDQVHKDMEYRFDQCQLICNQITDEFKRNHHINQECENKVIKIYSPLPYKDSRVVEVNIAFEQNYPTKYQEPFGYEMINSFKLYDANEIEIPYGISNIHTNYLQRTYNQDTSVCDLYTICFEADLIPTAFTEFMIKPYEQASRYLSRLQQTERSAENDFISLTINDNGSICIFDKTTKKEYKNLLTLIDDGEIGDGWYHANPACDRLFTNTSAQIEKVENNAVRVVFKITQTMMIPNEITKNQFGIKRSETLQPFQVIHFVTLEKSSRWVSVKTKIHNNISDHRVRITIPTGIQGNRYFANQSFCFVERSTDIDFNTQNWKECEVIEKQMSGIVGKRDEKGGFAFISKYGLHECGVENFGTIYITLFRSFRKTHLTNGERTGQVLEDMEFEYILMPFDESMDFAQLQQRQDLISSELITIVENNNKAQNNISKLSIDSDTILFSTANNIKNGTELRFYNMSNTASTATVSYHCNKVTKVDFDGNKISELSVANNQFKIALNQWEIVTVHCL